MANDSVIERVSGQKLHGRYYNIKIKYVITNLFVLPYSQCRSCEYNRKRLRCLEMELKQSRFMMQNLRGKLEDVRRSNNILKIRLKRHENKVLNKLMDSKIETEKEEGTIIELSE